MINLPDMFTITVERCSDDLWCITNPIGLFVAVHDVDLSEALATVPLTLSKLIDLDNCPCS